MHSMYAKLFSRIAQSSLMEEGVETRYCFMMLLAIADSQGDVIGTDIAIARTVNLPLETFRACIEDLMKPDPDSNSQTCEGRRVVNSDHGRGYRVVNYGVYRAIKSEEEKRAYMREYMRARRKSLSSNDVKRVNVCKDPLTDVTHAEAEAETDTESKKTLGKSISKSRVPEPSDEEWLAALGRDPTYSGINVSVEYGKMRRWCEANGKKPSRRRFVNWLNRADRPMTAAGGSGTTVADHEKGF